MAIDQSVLQSVEFRNNGPHRGGRVVAAAGDVSNPMVFYFGACTGGVWKTVDGGTYWENVSDGFFTTAAVGAIAVSESDPNVIYAGMGEACIRGNVSHGDGVYKSTDAGKTWTNVGLKETRHISRVRIDPKNSDLVYVAALGHAWGPNPDRGIFRSKDGGKSWERVLFRTENAGAADLCIDTRNPRILYAAIWEAHRTAWSLESGGPDSSIYKSSDGGDTWTDITGNPGLPKGLKGRIGVSASPAQSGRVWAVMDVEDGQGGLYRSDDGGDNWTQVSEDRNLIQRPWYYDHVYADTQDPDTVYVLNLQMWKSTDGGRSITPIPTPHGDNHELWIDPNNNQRMIEGNDGGACVSFNGGSSWSTIYNQPTAQFYHLDTDNRFPYRVYGTQQDNSAICAPSRVTDKAGIPISDCYQVGHAESGYIQVRPDDPDIVYSGAVGSSPGGGGSMLRWDGHTDQTRIITVWPEVQSGWGAKHMKYRFQWTYPIVISPHDPNVLYATGNQVFRSTNEGQSWEEISPDLTRNDPDKLGPSGGPVTRDTTGAEHYCTIFAFAESPHEKGVFWAGSDDGLVHISRDGGTSWQNNTPPDLPEWTTISLITTSPHDPATAYVAAHRYRLHDNQPYLYKTNDYGKSWQRINNGIPSDDFTRCIREDPTRRGLLFAGTETGLYVSADDGANWQRVQGNLPAVPVYDLQFKDEDLVLATHGRSFWILDDLGVIRQLAEGAPTNTNHLFQPRTAYRVIAPRGFGRPGQPGKNYGAGLGVPLVYYENVTPAGEVKRKFINAGQNPPDGVIVEYVLNAKPEGEVKLSFVDSKGQEIRSFSSKAPAELDAAGSGTAAGTEGREARSAAAGGGEPQEQRIPAEAGLNRFVWNMRYPDAVKVPGDITTEQSTSGPVAAPGSYEVRLTVNGQTQSQPFVIAKDPRVAVSQQDLDEQLAFLLKIRDKLSETNEAINQIRDMKGQVEEWVKRAAAEDPERERARIIADAGRNLKIKLTSIEDELIQGRAKAGSDTLNFPSRLNARLAAIPSVVISADAAPQAQAYGVFDKLSGEIDQQLQQLRQVMATDVAGFNDLIRNSELPAVLPKSSQAQRGALAGAAARQDGSRGASKG
jgi:photosystem II stability/assembly factor-like uncharacterized protein